jgi:hypothetical protein
VKVNDIPALASAYQQRSEIRERIGQARTRHGTVVLTQVLAGGGGVGKSQTAAGYAHQALADGTDLVMWAPATGIDEVITLYAQAAVKVQVPDVTGQDAEKDARAFLAWLATTKRSWLVVLDDVTDPAAMGRWWPPASAGGRGRVLATTRRRDAVLSEGGRAVVAIDTYTRGEASAYLRDRLTDASHRHLLDGAADALAEALGLLPLALSHAAAYMINAGVACSAYLTLFNTQNSRLDALFAHTAEGYGRQVAAALLLSLKAAQNSEPVGLAEPALRLTAVLDPAGHPRTLWDTPAVLRYLTQHRTQPVVGDGTQADTEIDAGADTEVNAGQALAVLRVLHRYGLITDHAPDGPRAVTLHALTARATRETTPHTHKPNIHQTAADALLGIWPDPDQVNPALATALRANTTTLTTHAHDDLWAPGPHPVLFRAGTSLLDAGLHAAATTHWEPLTHDPGGHSGCQAASASSRRERWVVRVRSSAWPFHQASSRSRLRAVAL